MNKECFIVSQATCFLNALAAYEELLTQVENKVIKTSLPVHEGLIKIVNVLASYDFHNTGLSCTKSIHNPYAYSLWKEVDIHIVEQSWPSSDHGWNITGIIARPSTKPSTNVVIENRSLGFACIFWDGIFAYMLKIDTSYNSLIKISGYRLLPDIGEVDKGMLTVLFKNPKYD